MRRPGCAPRRARSCPNPRSPRRGARGRSGCRAVGRVRSTSRLVLRPGVEIVLVIGPLWARSVRHFLSSPRRARGPGAWLRRGRGRRRRAGPRRGGSRHPRRRSARRRNRRRPTASRSRRPVRCSEKFCTTMRVELYKSVARIAPCRAASTRRAVSNGRRSKRRVNARSMMRRSLSATRSSLRAVSSSSTASAKAGSSSLRREGVVGPVRIRSNASNMSCICMPVAVSRLPICVGGRPQQFPRRGAARAIARADPRLCGEAAAAQWP